MPSQICVARIGAAHGVRGAVKLWTFTEDPLAVTRYGPLSTKDGALLGSSCRADRDKEIRAALFPEDLTMPPNCAIKAKFAVRARVTGNVGIYHLRGCPSYAAMTKPDRWFCSEDDAQASGFRKAFNCQANRAKK